MFAMYVEFMLLLLIAPFGKAIIGFDCGGTRMNVTTISLLSVGDCNLNITTPRSTDVYIQLLQLSDYNHAEIIQCKVEITKTIHYCGMHSHISVVQNGYNAYLHETGYSTCRRMIEDGVLLLGSVIIDGLKPNQTVYRSVTLAGTIKLDGTCKGTQYSDPYGTWDDVVVQAIVRISLKSSYVPVRLNSDKIILKSGTICTLSDGLCIDSDDGYTFWKPMPTSTCNFNQYDILYEGVAQRIVAKNNDSKSLVLYSLTTNDVTFALTTTSEQPLCGYTLLRTEHPKLFILQTQRGNTFISKKIISVDNLDIFTYVNSKFVYVEKHIRTQMTSLYYNVVQQRCKLEIEVIKNTLSFATLQPDEFAYRLMKRPGYMAVTAGEVVHVIKCIPTDVIVRREKKCYIELPVSMANTSYFLTPKSRILTKVGTERECSDLLPTMYRLEDTWVRFSPNPIVIQQPEELQPMTNLTWKYLTPGSLAVSGIYTEKDIQRLRDHIMFPAEKPAVLNSVARGITGHSMSDISMYDLFNEEVLDKIASNTAQKIWNGFITFGSATAGVVGIIVLLYIVKLIISTFIRCFELHSAYGCSMHLLGAIWSSITHLLLYLRPRNKLRKDMKSNVHKCSCTQDSKQQTENESV